MLVKTEVKLELLGEKGLAGAYALGDVACMLPCLLSEYEGKAQLIYLDPPFATGQQFGMRMRVGEKDWNANAGSLLLPTYEDDLPLGDYLNMMREVLSAAKRLLNDTGVIFLHIDFRMHARLRLLMDEIFGEGNLLNEIIWSYQTGGRARRYFSRKHDVILFYRKTGKYYFNISAVPVQREGNRRNHMKRHVDTDGRVYRSIRSGGKIYTYYDDEPAFPGDVWDDVSHMQQKDPQRTGYDTQKPLKLLERIVRCASKPGDLVMDLFAGSGTTLEAAAANGRRFVGVDKGLLSMHVVRKRLSRHDIRLYAPPCAGDPLIEVNARSGIAYYDIEITKYEIESGLIARTFAGLDALDGWAAGYIRDGAFLCMTQEQRTKQDPKLKAKLQLPVLDGEPVIRVSDVLGRYFYYAIDLGSIDR